MAELSFAAIAKSVGLTEQELVEGVFNQFGIKVDPSKPLDGETKQKLVLFIKGAKTGKELTLKRTTSHSLGTNKGRQVDVQIKGSKSYTQPKAQPSTSSTYQPAHPPPPPPAPPVGLESTTKAKKTAKSETKNAELAKEQALESGQLKQTTATKAETAPETEVKTKTTQSAKRTKSTISESKTDEPVTKATTKGGKDAVKTKKDNINLFATESFKPAVAERATNKMVGQAATDDQPKKRKKKGTVKADLNAKPEKHEKVLLNKIISEDLEEKTADNLPIGDNDSNSKPSASTTSAKQSKPQKSKVQPQSQTNSQSKAKYQSKYKTSTEKTSSSKATTTQSKHKFVAPTQRKTLTIELGDNVSVQELAKKLHIKSKVVVKTLKNLGESANIDSILDYDSAYLVIEELGHNANHVVENTPEMLLLKSLAKNNQYERTPRPPVVTIMGHVDHGKTTLLDFIRKANVADAEAGGITQHLSAYHVNTAHGIVTFVDTPGHAAFTAMRARGSRFTDIVVLIVAANDGVMPQTIEIIQHVKAAEVPMIIAVNKIDLPDVNLDKILQELSQHDVITEKWGGDIPVVELSAKTGQGVSNLLELLALQAEIMELKARTKGSAEGTILECRIDKGRGVVASVLVQNGTLQRGDLILSGQEYGKIKAIIDSSTGKPLKKTSPSIPVEVLGFSGLPETGEHFVVSDNERQVREVAEFREQQAKKPAQQRNVSLDSLFEQMDLDEDNKIELNLIVRADTQGSVEALSESLTKLSGNKVNVKVVASGVGGIKESDATLAMAYSAIIIGFNVRADKMARNIIERENLDLHYYSIIYQAIDEVKQAILGKLEPEVKEEIIGVAEVRDVFRVKRYGSIAGCMVTEGEVKRHNPIRVLRDNVVIYEGELESLKRHQEDVSQVRNNVECGIGVRNYSDVRVGDLIEVYEKTLIRPTSL